jgi:hypothetical protein
MEPLFPRLDWNVTTTGICSCYALVLPIGPLDGQRVYIREARMKAIGPTCDGLQLSFTLFSAWFNNNPGLQQPCCPKGESICDLWFRHLR